MFNPIRVGVLGCGNMGRNHLRVLSSMSQFQLVGCFDTNASASKEQAALYGIKQFDSQEELFDQVELVHVVVPSFLHRDAAVAAANAGCHVLVEKPIALTIEDAQAIVDACDASGVKLCVGHVERFNPAIVALAGIVANEEVLSVDFHRMSPYDKRVSDASVVQDLMIHDIDVLNWIADSPVRRVQSQGRVVYSDKPDYVQALVEFENGLVASLTASRITESKVRSAEINAKDAFISVDYLNRSVTCLWSSLFAQNSSSLRMPFGIMPKFRQAGRWGSKPCGFARKSNDAFPAVFDEHRFQCLYSRVGICGRGGCRRERDEDLAFCPRPVWCKDRRGLHSGTKR